MCSSCFRANAKQQESSSQQVQQVQQVKRDTFAGVTTCVPAGTSAVPKPLEPEPQCEVVPAEEPEAKPQAEAAVAPSPSRPPQKHKNRCYSCRKKIGLTGFTCKCGYIFCSEHRYSDKHDCPYDYKLAGREGIAKANPKVVASKINKI